MKINQTSSKTFEMKFMKSEKEMEKISTKTDLFCRKICHFKNQSIPTYSSEKFSENSEDVGCLSALSSYTREKADKLTQKAENVAEKFATYGYKLLSHWELPDWMKDNSYLHHFHRPKLKNFRLCFQSIFSIHTETGNIWTHLIGLIVLIIFWVIIFLQPVFWNSPYPNGFLEYLCFGAFFAGGCSCLTFSWLFHTLFCHSKKVNKLMAKFDYCGIAFLTCGSMIAFFYFIFYCQTKLMITYMCITSLMASLCIAVSMADTMSTTPFRPIRGCIFLAYGLSVLLPLTHNFLIYPFDYFIENTQFTLLIIIGLLYIFGCLIYMFLIPERFFPGRLNTAIHSHQIFHVCVVCAIFVTLKAICQMSSLRNSKGRICLPGEYLL